MLYNEEQLSKLQKSNLWIKIEIMRGNLSLSFIKRGFHLTIWDNDESDFFRNEESIVRRH